MTTAAMPVVDIARTREALQAYIDAAEGARCDIAPCPFEGPIDGTDADDQRCYAVISLSFKDKLLHFSEVSPGLEMYGFP